MGYLQSVTLAILQGITEWLPISSSAHLILLPWLTGWPDQGLGFDVAVHTGSLLAVLAYFRTELQAMTKAWFHSLVTGQVSDEAKLAWALLLGTIPVGLAGLAFKDIVETALRNPRVLAWALIGFGLLLWLSDLGGRRIRTEDQLSWKDVAFIGCAQALALIPGTSRSGITMTAALTLDWTREAAARFSFLLGIPVIALAGGLDLVELMRGELNQPAGVLAIGFLTSAVAAYLCLWAFLAWIRRVGMAPFAVYRLLLGGTLLIVF